MRCQCHAQKILLLPMMICAGRYVLHQPRSTHSGVCTACRTLLVSPSPTPYCGSSWHRTVRPGQTVWSIRSSLHADSPPKILRGNSDPVLMLAEIRAA